MMQKPCCGAEFAQPSWARKNRGTAPVSLSVMATDMCVVDAAGVARSSCDLGGAVRAGFGRATAVARAAVAGRIHGRGQVP